MKKTLLALLVSSSLFAHDNLHEHDHLESGTISYDQKFNYKDQTFIELGFGKGNISIDDNTFNIPLSSGTLENNPLITDVSVGYGITDNLLAGLHYQYNKLDNANIENIYFNLDYVFSLNSLHMTEYSSLMTFKPFIGFLAGTSSLSWDNTPVEGATSTSNTSSKFFYGVEAGVIRPINDKLFLGLKYQLTDLNHKTVIGTETIYHNNQNSLIFSLNYKGNFLNE